MSSPRTRMSGWQSGLTAQSRHPSISPMFGATLSTSCAKRDYVRTAHGPKENHTRPAVDPLSRSAALAYGADVIGVVLTGNLDNGTAGLLAIKDCGGLTVVQDPNEALAPSMPLNALRYVRSTTVCLSM